MLMRAPATPPARRSPLRRVLDWCDDWRQSAGIGAVLFVILAGVSAYYLVRWGHDNGMPGPVAWALPAALDLTGYRAVIIAKRARDWQARQSAMTLVWSAVGLSMLGNIGSHAIDAGLLRPNFWTMAATVSVIPLMAIWGHLVGGGIAERPEITAAADEQEQTRRDLADVRRALAAATARAEEAERERDELRARKPRPAAPRKRAETPPPPQQPPVAAEPPASTPAEPKPQPAERQRYTPAQLEAAIEYLACNPGKGRRAMVSGIGGGIGDNPSKTLHKDALGAIEALPEAALAALRARAEQTQSAA